MTPDLLRQLDQKIASAVEIIEFLRLQVEELEEQNITLKAEQEKWRHELMNLLKRLEQIDGSTYALSAKAKIQEDEFASA